MEISLLSVIVPIYKQEKTIKEDLLSIHSTLSKTPYKFEIIGVVDGTTLDNSLSEAKKVKKDNVKIFGYKNNKGKGQAVRFGMQKASGDVISFIDSGMDIAPAGIVMLLEHMKWYNADIIIGSKLHPASKVKNYPAKRRFLTYCYYMMVKTLFGLKVRDTQTGLKAYKRKVLEKVLDLLVVKTFAFDIELLAVANKLGFKKIYDAPVIVNWEPTNTSLGKVFRSGIIRDFMMDTLAVWYRMNILKYYYNGRHRVKIFDKDLGMNVNTGAMYEKKRQYLIDFVNKILHHARH
ncbi:hypothetical protein CO058_01055 [candidate division WWE3 bacterium CG_4_9_14_0_2_um_filter_35_11]|uniref:Glycosyltransferase 2-like domain-containing protein n=1 Tax=candidate division WWE3 bacterium CG_4_9_14_0_2_um_filter_35_11 TaxID=1975077 RepID=A0A2M8EMJ8_UNCKA|nr:MAG: hypothetical protein COV25_00310 [candidate division WWE3 bacterium CG10_big_fil_rev_8_21_14_0_10_35_32]PJC23907.1 MAG: hypothetical protein CO058_01055 [candidate division WWE3 bacterium CG_4_9_14_0_2_um_filter_35_11]